MKTIAKRLPALVVLLATLAAVPAPLAAGCPENLPESGCWILFELCRASSACHYPKDCLEFYVWCGTLAIKRVPFGCKC